MSLAADSRVFSSTRALRKVTRQRYWRSSLPASLVIEALIVINRLTVC